jgi:hypothetical protein
MVNLIDESKCKFKPIDKLQFIKAAAQADLQIEQHH